MAVLRLIDWFEFGRRLHRKIGRLVAPQDAINVGRRLSHFIDTIGAVGHEPAGRDEIAEGIYRGQAMVRCQLDDQGLCDTVKTSGGTIRPLSGAPAKSWITFVMSLAFLTGRGTSSMPSDVAGDCDAFK